MADLAALYSAFDTDPAHIVAFLHWLADEHRLRPAPAALDVGCGPGRLIAPLAALGWRVTAMEPEPSFRARAESLARGHGARVLPGGWNDIDGESEYNLVAGINGSFSYLPTPADRLDAFHRAFRALRSGGVLFIDVPNFIWILTNYRAPEPFRSTLDGRAVTLTRTPEIDVHAATFTTLEEYVVEGEEPVRMRHVYAMTSFPELEAAMHAAGFSDVRTSRSRPYGRGEADPGRRIGCPMRHPRDVILSVAAASNPRLHESLAATEGSVSDVRATGGRPLGGSPQILRARRRSS